MAKKGSLRLNKSKIGYNGSGGVKIMESWNIGFKRINCFTNNTVKPAQSGTNKTSLHFPRTHLSPFSTIPTFPAGRRPSEVKPLVMKITPNVARNFHPDYIL
jgi:hypothetical protein